VSGSSANGIEAEVLRVLREHGPISANETASKVRRRRIDVLRTLRSLRSSGQVLGAPGRFIAADGRGTTAEPRPCKPRGLYFPVEDAKILVAHFEELGDQSPAREALRRALRRRQAAKDRR
jgi:predicted ArsR family transcriptional regulator